MPDEKKYAAYQKESKERLKTPKERGKANSDMFSSTVDAGIEYIAGGKSRTNRAFRRTQVNRTHALRRHRKIAKSLGQKKGYGIGSMTDKKDMKSKSPGN